MVRATNEKRDVGSWKAGARRLAWGMVKRAMQGAVIFAVGASVPEGWSAGSAAPPVSASGKVALHVDNIPVGTAAFSRAGAVTTVTTGSARTIINYSYLNVGAGATLNFAQPSVSSSVLNRISGANPTRVDGSITSNGAVWLVNPGGVFFGKGAVINTGQFVAAASHVSDASFLSGSKNFTGATGSVVNMGTISAQEVHLTGLNVANFGTIATPPGTGGVVTMTSGQDVYIGTVSSPASHPLVMVKVSNAGATQASGTGVVNAGSVRAPGGQVRVGAGDLFAAGIYNSGTIAGSDVTVDSGKGTNISTGRVDASNSVGKGGQVEMLGSKVGVEGTIDASGATGGGTVLIGGALHGGGGVPVSDAAVVTMDAVIHADATQSGEGGTVVVFSSQFSRVDGLLTALGVSGGVGGMIETSSEGTLSVTRMPELGAGGTWLMDPSNVTIANPATDMTSSGTNPLTFTSNNPTSNVKADDIKNQLQNGVSVIIDATAGSGTGTGTITLSNNINPSSGSPQTATLTLNGKSDVSLGAQISAGNQMTLNVVVNSSQGNVSVNSGGSITTNGGSLAISAGGNVVISDNITTSGGAFTSSGVDFTLLTGKTIDTHSASLVGGLVALSHTGNVSISGSVLTGNGTFWSEGADFTNTGPIGAGGGINLMHTGNVSLGADVNAVTGVVAITGQSVSQSAGNVTSGGLLVQTSGGSPVDAVKLTSPNNALGNIGITVGSGGNVTIVSLGPVRFDTIAAPTGSPFLSNNFATQSGVTATGSTVSVTSSGGSLTVSNNINTGATGTVQFKTTGPGDIDGDGAGHSINAGVSALTSAGDVGGAGGLDVIIDPSTAPAITATVGAVTNSVRLAFTAGAVQTSQITVTNGSVKDFSVQTNGTLGINSAVNIATGNTTLTASGASIAGLGGSVTGATLSLASNGGSVGNVTNPIVFSATVSTAVTTTGASGDVFIQPPATLSTPVTITTDTNPHTIGLMGPGGLTIGTNVTAGGNDTLIVTDPTSVTLNSGSTLSGGTVYVTSAGNVQIKGNVTAGTLALLQGNSVTDGGTGIISAPTLGVNATGSTAGVSISLTQANAVTTFATGNAGTGSVAFTASGSLATGNVSALSPSGFTAFGAESGVNGNGGNVSLTAAGDITNSGAGVSGGNVSVTSTGAGVAISQNYTATAGVVSISAQTSISGTGGTVSGTNVTLTATTGGISGSSVFTATGNTTFSAAGSITNSGGSVSGGNVSVTSTGAGITISENYTATTGDVTMSGQTIGGTGGTVSGANVTLAATTGGISGSSTITAGTGTANLTASGDITNSGGVVSGPVVTVTSTGGAIAVSENYTATTGNATLTARTNITNGGGVVSGANVLLTATTGGIGAGGSAVQFATGGGTGNLVLLTGGAAHNGDIFVTTANAVNTSKVLPGNATFFTDAGSVQLVSVASTGGAMTVDTAFSSPNTVGIDDLALSGTSVAVNAALTGGTVGLTSGGAITGGGITAGTLTLNAATTISLTGNAVSTLVATSHGTLTFDNNNGTGLTLGNMASNGGIITVTEGTGNVTVSGTVAAGGVGSAVVVEAHLNILSGGGVISGGALALTADTGGIGASGPGNAVQFNTAGTVTLLTGGVGSAGDIFLQTSGALNTSQLVPGVGPLFTNNGSVQLISIVSGGTLTVDSVLAAVSGAGHDDVTLSGSVLTMTGAGSVAGGNVTLAATAGGLTANGAVSADGSANLTATGGDVALNADVTAGGSVTLTGGNIAQNANVTATGNTTLTATSGSITSNGAGVVSGANITLASSGIGDGTNAITVTLGSGNLSLTGSGAGIFVTSITALDLGKVTINDTAGETVSLRALSFTTSGNLTAAGDTLILTATLAGGTTTITSNISAQSITLISDNLAVSGGGALLANATSGTLQIEPLTPTRTINLSGTPVGGEMNVDPALLTASTASAVKLGGTGVSGNMTVNTANLSAGAFGMTLQTTGTVMFTGTLTLANNTTLAIDGANGVLNSAPGTAIVIDGGSGTVVFSNLKGGVGNSTANLTTEVSFLSGMSGNGTVHLSNFGNLTINGAGVSLANGVGGNLIEAHSPLDITASVTVAGDLALTATGGPLTVENHAVVTANGGNVTLTAGTDMNLGNNTAGANSAQVVSTGGNVTVFAGGNITLDANSTISAVGNSVNLTTSGFITVNGTTPVVTAATLGASAGTGIKLDSNGITVGNFSATNTTSGDIVFKDQGNVVITGISESGGGNVSLTVLGSANQTGAASGITTGGGNLLVQTQSTGGPAGTIVLTNAGNNLGAGLATLQVRDAGNGTTVSADVQFTTSGPMHLQQVDAGTSGNVTLSGTTIDQIVGDPVGIHGAGLTVNSKGDVTLTDLNNIFSTLTVSDTNGVASHLAFETKAGAAGGLTIAGFSQTTTGGGANASITNQTGGITSNLTMTTGDLTLTAGNVTPGTGGIVLSNGTNSIRSITLTNFSSGNIDVHDSSDLIVKGSTQNSAGNSTNFTVAGNLSVTGDVGAGTALTVDVGTVGASRTFSTSGANITASANITIKADDWFLDAAKLITAPNVTLRSEDPVHALAFDGTAADSGAGLSNHELDVAHTANLALGDSTLTGITSAGAVGGVSFGTNVTANVTLTSGNTITLAAADFTTNGPAAVLMQHAGTLTLANGTFGGTFTESSSAGGTTQLSGLIQTTNQTVTFNSLVQLTGSGASVSTVGTTGAAIKFGFIGATSVVGSSAGGQNLTLTAGTSIITFASPVGTAGIPLGTLTVNSVGTLTLPTVFATGENITHSGVLTVSGVQTLGAGGFTEGGTGTVAIGANIASAGGANVFNSPAALGTNLAITGTATTFNGTLTGNSKDLTVNGDGTFATVNGIGNLVVTGNGSFGTIAGATSVTVDGNGTFGTTTSFGSVHVVGNGTFNGLLNGGAVTVDTNGSFSNVTLTNALLTGGTALFNAPVSASSVNVGGLATLGTLATSITTTGGPQTYGGGMMLNTDAALSGTTVTIGSTLADNGHNLTIGNDAVLGNVSGSGKLHVLHDATFDGTVNTGTLQVDNNAIVNTANITSNGTLTVNGVTNLGTSTTLNGSVITLTNGITGNGHDITANGTAVFGAIAGAGFIHVTTAAQFNGPVSNSGGISVDGTTNIATSSISTAGTQTYTGVATLSASPVTLTGTTVTFGNSLVATGQNLTVAGNGTFSGVSGMGALVVVGNGIFNGTVGAGSVLVGGTSAINTTTITTTGTQTYTGVATLGASNVTLTGTTVSFGNSLIGTTGQNLTVTGSGVFNAVNGVGTLLDNEAATFHGTVSAGNVTVDGPVSINANITTTGTHVYLGAATLGTTTKMTGTSVSFGSTLTGTTNDLAVIGNGTFQTIASLRNLSVTGIGTFGGNVTASSVLVGGNSFVTAGSITTTGTQTYTGNVTVDPTNVSLPGSTLTLGGPRATGSDSVTVNGTGVFNAVSGTGALTANGPATFGGNISEGTLSVSGTTTINTANITTTGTQTYTGTTTLGQTAALSGSTVTFGTLTGNAHDLTVSGVGTFGTVTAMHNLTVNGTGTFTKAVTATGLVKVTGAGSFNAAVSAGSLTVGGAATLLQNVTTSGDQTYNGLLTVNLTNRNVTLLATGPVPSGSTGSISINSGLSGSGSGVLTLQTARPALGLIVSDTNHAMKIAGTVDLGAATLNIINGGVVQFAPVGGTVETVKAAKISFALPDGQAASDQIVATIFDRSGDLTFNTPGGFFMGHGETMTVFNPAGGGSLNILSPAGNITLGDLTALGDINVDSGGHDIAFQVHGNISLPDNLNSPNRFTQTTGVVSGGTVTMNGKLTIPDDNKPKPPPLNFKDEVWFSVANPERLHLSLTQVSQQSANGTTATAQFFSFSQTTALSATQLDSAGLVLYAPADGSAPAFALQSSIPRDVQSLQPERAATVAGTMLEDLQHLGVNARAANNDELLAYLLGNAIYNDIPKTLTPTLDDMRVAANRLPNSPILPTVSAYRALFYEPVVDSNGATKNAPDGTPLTVNRREKIQNAFELAWEAYTLDEPKGAPEGLRAYLESKKSDPKMAEALDYLNKMRTLMGQIRSLGLTDTEFAVAEGVLFKQVKPQNIPNNDAFLSAIMGTTQAVKQNVPASPKAEAPEENPLKNVTAMK